jgi:hypothetical protein
MIRQALLPAAIVLVLLWLPLPFGSTPLWAQTVFLLLSFGTLVGVALRAEELISSHDSNRLLLAMAMPAGIGLFGVLQSLEWRASLVRALSPEHYQLVRDDLLALAGSASVDPELIRFVPLSLAPSLSRWTALLWLAVAALGLAGLAIGRERRWRRWMLWALVASALFQVIYGGQEWYRRSGRIWAVEVPGDASRLRGTFVNSDHFALYLELILPLVFAWCWWAIRRQRRSEVSEWGLIGIAAPILIWLTLFTSIAFSGSRAGIVAAIAATVGQGLLIAASSRRRKIVRLGWAPAGMIAALVGVMVVALLGLQQGFGRWRATSAYELTWNERLLVYSESFEAWLRFPFFGSGLGTFREAFALVRPPELDSTYLHAHNDWLELLVTTGLVGMAMLVVGLGLVLWRLVRIQLKAVRSEERAAALGVLGALVAVAIHSCLDFGLAMPANAATLAVLLGVGTATPLVVESLVARESGGD